MSDNKSVLVTGASRGIGRETALTLAENGFRVWAGVRDVENSLALEKEALDRGGKLTCIHLDVTDEDSHAKALQTILDEDSSLFALVNNAAVVYRGYLEDLTMAEIREILETNLIGVIALTRRVTPVMRRAQNGRIIIMSSIGGKIGTMGLTGYIASKFALEGFGESLYLELHPLNIHVSLIEPGIVKTELWNPKQRVSKGGNNTDSPYYDWFQRAEELADSLVKSATVTPSQVALTIHRALSESNPALRYGIGRRAKAVLVLRRILPDRVFDRLYFGQIMKRVTGIHK